MLSARNNLPTEVQNSSKFLNPKQLTIDFSKTIQGLAVSNMLHTSDGGLLTVGTVAIEPYHSILTKLSANGDIEWVYKLTTKDTSLYINNMQEIVEITNGYEISGSFRLEKFLASKGNRYRLLIDKHGNMVSKWMGLLKNDSISGNTDIPAIRNYNSFFNTVGIYSFDFTNQTVTPFLVDFDENGNQLNEVVFTNNKIFSTNIHASIMIPTHDRGMSVVFSCDGQGEGDTTGFLQLWKFDKSGNYEWSRQLPEVYRGWWNRQYCSAIQTKDGGFVITNMLESNSNPVDRKSSIILRKYDNDGKLLFTKSFTPLFYNYIKSIKETPSGDLILAGHGQDSSNSKSKDNKYLLIRTTSNGELIWFDSFGETTSGNLILNLAVADEHTFLLGGQNNYGVGINTSQAIVMKVRDGVSDVEEFEAISDNITISPNPTSTSFILRGIDNISSMKILNSIGMEVSRMSFNESSKQEVDVSNLPSGVYFVQIRTSTGMISKPIVISR